MIKYVLALCVGTLSPSTSCINVNGIANTSSIEPNRTTDVPVTSYTIDTTLALPAIDAISYCAHKAAEQELAQNPEALHQACKEGNLSKVQLLIDVDACVNAQDINNITPLHEAIDSGHAKVAALLIGRNALVDAQDSSGSMPLHKAVAEGSLAIVKLLLHHNARIDIQDNDGWTPLYLAVCWNNDKSVELMMHSFFNPRIVKVEPSSITL